MANKVFFKIGSTDLTDRVDIQNYKMNQQDVVVAWTDGNWKDRQTIARTRITGTVKLGFKSITDFEAFQQVLEDNRNADEGYYPVTAYVATTGETVTFNAYLDITAAGSWDLAHGRQWIVQTISVEER